MVSKRLCYTLLFSLSFNVWAQIKPLSFDRFDDVKALTNQSINALVQDAQGFIWLGTADGLIRFDGTDIRTFKNNARNKNSLADNNIRSLARDGAGNLWIATQGGGLDRFNLNEERFYHHRSEAKNDSTLSGNAVWSVAVDAKGRVWAGTWSDGLNYYLPDKKRFVRVRSNRDPIMAIAEDDRGNIWFGSGGLNRYNPETESLKTYPLLMNDGTTSSAGIRALLLHDGNVWAATDNDGIFVFNTQDETFTQVVHDQPMANQVYALYVHDNAIWAATNAGLAVVQGNAITHLMAHQAGNLLTLRSNAARAMLRDGQGGLWVGLEGAGVNRALERKNFITFRHDANEKNSLSFNLIRSVYDDRSGKIWVGTQGGGLNIYDPVKATWQVVGTGAKGDFALSSNQVSSLYQDADGVMWIGTWGGGLNKVNLATGETRVFRTEAGNLNSIPDDRVQVTYLDKQGTFWVGTENGLAVLDPKTETWTRYPHDENNPNSIIGNNIQGQAFVETQDGSLWIGTWFGLNRFDAARKNFTRFTSDSTQVSPLSNDHVISLHADPQDNIWIGTFGGGLNQLNSKTGAVVHYSENEGLPSNTIFAIRQDGVGNLWLSTSKGLSRFNPSTKTFRNYDVSEGLQSNEFYWGAAHMARDSSLLFGGINGLNWFKPEDITDNTEPPSVVITDFQIFNKSVEVGPESVLKQAIQSTQQITLRYDQAVLGFQFAALNFNYPGKNQFAYKLENFETDWNYVGDKRTATYTNLDPGEYIFRVKASNNDNVWNETGVALTIIITPPFWRTWWFYLLLVAGGGGAVVGFVRYRLRELKRDKEQLRETLESSLKQAQDELTQQKQNIEQEEARNAERNWTDQSLAKFGDLLSKSKNDVQALCSSLLTEVVRHLTLAGGAIYIYDSKSGLLNPEAKYGYEKLLAVEPGQGMTGACFADKERKLMNQIPAEYFRITSGLGMSTPTALMLIPIKFEEVCLGVMELAAFETIPEYKIKLLELLAERLTTIVNTTLMAQQTQRLLEETRVQAEELKMREEELRQNLEELQAINEDRDRKTKELERKLAALENRD